MKALSVKTKSRSPSTDRQTKAILESLRDARKAAVKSARLHRTPVIYLSSGTLVKARVS